MALVQLLLIGSDGLQEEHDPAADSSQWTDILAYNGGSPVNIFSGVDGSTVITDDDAAYTNITPSGDSVRDTLLAIDTYLGTLSALCNIKNPYTNAEAGSMALGDAVYVSANDSVSFAKNDDSAKDDPIGIAGEAILTTASGDIITSGCVDGALSGATAGAKYFLSNTGTTGNTLTATLPTGSGQRVTLMGYAKNATDLQMHIQQIGRNT